MANTYTWEIPNLDVKISHDGNDNVVHTVHWIYKTTDENDNVSIQLGTHSVEYDADNFTLYDSLTKEDVVGWLTDAETGLDVIAMQNRGDAEVALLATPTDRSFANPFSS